VESTVNQVVSKRFVKKQQMQWTPRGAHLLLQTRPSVAGIRPSVTTLKGWPHDRLAPGNLRSPDSLQKLPGNLSKNEELESDLMPK
jgi:hypothetical protein